MSKIILKQISYNQTGWFCENCNNQIYDIPENLFSRPLTRRFTIKCMKEKRNDKI